MARIGYFEVVALVSQGLPAAPAKFIPGSRSRRQAALSPAFRPVGLRTLWQTVKITADSGGGKGEAASVSEGDSSLCSCCLHGQHLVCPSIFDRSTQCWQSAHCT